MIEDKYNQLHRKPSDINEHFPVIKKYAEQSESIVELGVRAMVSTWALLAGKPKRMLSIDITHPEEYGGNTWEAYEATMDEGIEYSFKIGDSLTTDIPECDLLFIDTIHKYEFLSVELERHSSQAKKFILMHDLHIGEEGMTRALNEFLQKHPEWQIIEDHENCNGLTVLGRV